MKTIKKIGLLAVIVFSLLLLVACGSRPTNSTEGDNGDATSSDKGKIGVLFYKYDDTYISSVRQALEDLAKDEANIELLLNDSKGDQATQNDQIDVLIQKGVDSLLVNIVDVGAVQTVIDKAQEADIPVIFFNREPEESVLKSYDKARFVGTTPEEAGEIQGEMALTVWQDNKEYDKNEDGVMNYVMLMGDADNPEAIARTKFSVETIEAGGVKVNKLGEQVANWDADKANTAVSAWLSREEDNIEMILANNDSMASGAISALQSAGYNKGESDKYIPVFGVDATDEAIDLISKGFLTGSVKQDAEGMAQAILALGMNAAQAKEFIAGTEYQYDSTGIAIRIPYQAYTGE